jgi:hypothetical protein
LPAGAMTPRDSGVSKMKIEKIVKAHDEQIRVNIHEY